MQNNLTHGDFDFFVRMDEQQLTRIALRILHVQADATAETPPAYASIAASGTRLSGFTEWVSIEAPVVSIGWDWVVSPEIGMTLVPDSIRTNVMLVDSLGSDRGVGACSAAITRLLHTLRWQDAVLTDLRERP
jgi:Domain of unknown function (DUF4902)